MVRFKHRLARLLLAITATATILVGCSDDDQGQEIDPSTAIGELRVQLVDTTGSMNVYRLGQALFQVTGATSASLAGDASDLRQTLSPGDYTVELGPNWVLERKNGEDFRAVAAKLVSPNPAPFQIVAGQTTTVAFRFEVAEDSGEINVRVGVGNDETTCRAQPSYGDVGTLAARLIVDDRTRGVTAPLGEPGAGTELALVLRSGRGVFGDGGPIRPGSYALTGAELDFATCGVCVLVHGDRDPDTGVPRQSYLATGGTVVIDSVFPTLAGSLRDVALSTGSAATDGQTPERTCTTALGAATFSVPNP